MVRPSCSSGNATISVGIPYVKGGLLAGGGAGALPGCLIILRKKVVKKLDESMRGPPVLTAGLVSEQ